MKKDFKDTKLGQWLNKAKDKLPEIASVGMEILTGDVGGAIEKIQDILDKKEKFNSEAAKLKQEFEMYKLDFQKELLQMEAADRADARAREREYVKSGKRDWMQVFVGFVGLSLLSCVIYVGLFMEIKDRETFYHVLGLVEGVGLSIFVYYFGSTQGSKNKQQTIDEMLKK
jgi:hypothetical protein